MADLKFSKRDLADNPSTRLPVCLVLDTSDSMQGERIEELNKGVKMFMDAISEDEILKYSSDIAIVTFGNKEFSEYTDVGEKNPVNGVKKYLILILSKNIKFQYLPQPQKDIPLWVRQLILLLECCRKENSYIKKTE